ncbi:hypothetical protein OSB04_015663 [Centaurea solstitialis]|uniref:Uncharacterized protein n=1 Tax=Centaurea solstitialis TaxID=347529 RepID=A0AA38TJH2_9ASTR|nr:hypothetical protein OSB04_015663 [Centaurea solstitialis]
MLLTFQAFYYSNGEQSMADHTTPNHGNRPQQPRPPPPCPPATRPPRPRGVGKTTLILERLLENWNKGPHVTGYVDFAQSIEENHPHHGHSFHGRLGPIAHRHLSPPSEPNWNSPSSPWLKRAFGLVQLALTRFAKP